MQTVLDITTLLSNGVSIVAGSIAVYLFLFKREKIKNLYFSLINILDQISTHEIKFKLERLNDYNCSDPEQKVEILNIMNEIVGQIQGNEKLEFKCKIILKKWRSALKRENKLTEQIKRSLISEMREILKRVDASSIDQLVGEKI